MFQAVLNSLQSVGTFSERDLIFFESKLYIRIVRKNNFILREGACCRAIYFSIEGSIIHFLPAIDGTAKVVNLYTRNSWLTDYQSLTSQKPATAFIQAFEDCELAVLDLGALHEIVLQCPLFFKAGKLIQIMQYNDISTANMSSEGRYRDLLEHRPELVKTFPLKVLASYLRITPETLSRIRRRIS